MNINNKSSNTIQEKEFAKLREALDKTTILATTDAAGVLTYVNDKFCDISQFARKELIGRDHSIVNSGYHDRKFFQKMWRTISAGKVWKGQIKNKAKDGSYYWVETTIVPFLDENKKPYQYIAIRTDITYQKEAERQIAEEHAKTIYAEKMASLGEMSAGIAHELGNPLGALRGRVEMLQRMAKKEEISPEKLIEFTEKSLTIIDRMSKIIRGVSAFAREASNDPYCLITLDKVISDILNFSNERLHKYHVTIDTTDVEKNIEFEAREAEIGQVLLNLISNSFDAIKELPERWIKIEAKQKSNYLEIAITDSGNGIPEVVAERIFNSFFTTKEVGKGTGLGLSISKKIIETYKGHLIYDSSSQNTRFIIKLPLTQNH